MSKSKQARARDFTEKARNGAIGCKYHHTLLDNGNLGLREEMREIFREYLMEQYPDWKEEELTYSKWDFLKGGTQ